MSSEKIGAGAVSDGALRALDVMQLPPFVVVCLPVEDDDLYARPLIKMTNVDADDDFRQFVIQEAERINQELFAIHDSGAYTYVIWLARRGTYDDPYYVVMGHELVAYESIADICLEPWVADYGCS